MIKKSGKGRTLWSNIPSLNLETGDRLEPSETLRNVGDFDEANLPLEVTFWRSNLESSTRHRNPLWNKTIGITPARTMTWDTLHEMNLGTMKRWCRITIWFLIECSIWGEGNLDELLQTSLVAMNNQLDAWYKNRHMQYPEEKLTRITKLSAGKLGIKSNPKCETKGAQTWGFLLYLLEVLEDRIPTMREEREHAEKLLKSGRALAGLVKTKKTNINKNNSNR